MGTTEEARPCRIGTYVLWHRRLPEGQWQTIPGVVTGIRYRGAAPWLRLAVDLPDRPGESTRWVPAWSIQAQ